MKVRLRRSVRGVGPSLVVGKTWWYGPQGITPGPVDTSPRSSSFRPRTQQQARKPARPRTSQYPLLSDREFFAPNLHVHFKLVRVGGAVGARLTRDASQDSAASRIQVNGAPIRLEAGDVIYNMDSLPIREAIDVMNHHGQTTLSFVDSRTGRALAGVTTLPAYTPLPDDVPRELFAANLGMNDQLIALGSDAFGARLSRTAAADTPAGALRLERGDMIIRLAGQPIRAREDVLSHFSQTSVEFINIRTGRLQMAYVQLLGETPGPSSTDEPLTAAPN